MKRLQFFAVISFAFATIVGSEAADKIVADFGGLGAFQSTTWVAKDLQILRIRRDAERCVNCGTCARHCPALLPVDKKVSIVSPECVGCLTCVSRCRAPGALDVALPRRRVIPPALYAAAVVAVFFGILLAARVTGHWHTGVSGAEYLRIVPSLRGLAHP